MVQAELFENENSIEIQLHFFFFDEQQHSMDADIFNTCERQFIEGLKTINHYLEKPLQIEVYAKKEGGLIEILSVVFNSDIAKNLILIFATAFFTSRFIQKKSKEEITKARLDNIAGIKEAVNARILTEDDYDYIAGTDKKLIESKSRFFATAKKENRLNKIEIESNTYIGEKLVFDKITVPYKQFDDFIIPEIETKEEEKDPSNVEAKIYIISPVLIEGFRTTWKGLWNNSSIDFTVSATKFLKEVYNHTHKFSNGSFILCKMAVVEKTLNGQPKKSSYDVYEVTDIDNDPLFLKHEKYTHKGEVDLGLPMLPFDDKECR